TNDAYNLLLSHTSDDYNLLLLHTDNAYNSFTDTYFNNIIASEDILDNFGNQQISDNAFDDFNNEVDVEDKAKEIEHEVDFENEDKEMKHKVDFEDKDKEMEPESRYSLTINQSVKTWKAVDELLEHYSQKRGFAFCITHSEIDKVDKELRCRVYTCTKGQTYVSHKEAHILSERNQNHKSMVQNITIVEARYCQLTKEMQDDVRLLSSCAIHFENHVASNADSTYFKLIKKQHDEPGYYVNAKFEGADNHLVDLMWMQPIELYNGIIKKHVNGSSSLFELSNIIERLLFKEDQYQHFNEVAGVLLAIHNEDYYNRYFDLVDKSCQKFLTTAILKIQYREINLSIHYRTQLVNLTDGLQSQITDEISAEMFSDDLFDAFVIELEELISDLNHTCIHEIWKVSSIDMKSSYVFTHKVHKEMSFKQWWEKRFSIMKKTLDLAIATGQYKELYEMHLNLMKEMKIELVTKDNDNMEDDNIELFAASISNPVGIHSKGINENLAHQENCCSIYSQARPNSCTCNSDVSNNQMNDMNKEGFNNVGHNARTCNLDSSSKQINNLVLEGHNYENKIRLLLLLPIASKNSGDLNLMSSEIAKSKLETNDKAKLNDLREEYIRKLEQSQSGSNDFNYIRNEIYDKTKIPFLETNKFCVNKEIPEIDKENLLNDRRTIDNKIRELKNENLSDNRDVDTLQQQR
ncbi:8847_t:CDS:10, partial [Cetraspora pellucida]